MIKKKKRIEEENVYPNSVQNEIALTEREHAYEGTIQTVSDLKSKIAHTSLNGSLFTYYVSWDPDNRVHGGDAAEQRVRVRRARPSDLPRLLRFVREHSRSAWPSLLSTSVAPSSASQLVLADYVSRALAQGHSMIAEQVASRRGILTVRGLALGASLCPWDAAQLESWARCLRCKRSRRLVHFTAHCMRAPELHDKYRVHNILQVILIIPPDALLSPDIVQVLAKSAAQRGKDAGFPLLRFDVTNDQISKTLEALKLKKEWHLSYDVLLPAEALTENVQNKAEPLPKERKSHFIAVYSTLTADSPLITDSPLSSSKSPAAKPTTSPAASSAAS